MGWLRKKKKGRLMGAIKKRPSEKKGQVFFFFKGVRVNSKRKNREGAHQKKMGFAKKKKKKGRKMGT